MFLNIQDYLLVYG